MSEIKQHPLIIVFYLDSDMMQNASIMKPFTESINEMLIIKDANALAFFLPTKGEERVEVLNPVQLKEEDLNKVYSVIDDIKKQFIS